MTAFEELECFDCDDLIAQLMAGGTLHCSDEYLTPPPQPKPQPIKQPFGRGEYMPPAFSNYTKSIQLHRGQVMPLLRDLALKNLETR